MEDEEVKEDEEEVEEDEEEEEEKEEKEVEMGKKSGIDLLGCLTLSDLISPD